MARWSHANLPWGEGEWGETCEGGVDMKGCTCEVFCSEDVWGRW